VPTDAGKGSRPKPQPQQPALPPGLDVLWGRRGSGSRGPRRGLSIDAVVAAAIRLADADGLESVSMARVAEELGFTTMSLYRYVTSKDELLQLMWNASAHGTETLVLEGNDWRSRLRHWAIVQREMIDRHPWITQMPMAAPPVAPNSLRFVELGLEAMDETGLADRDKIRIIGLLSSYTLSEARMAYDAVRAVAQAQAAAAEGQPADAPAQENAQAPQWSFEALLRELVDADTFPRLHRLAWSASADGQPHAGEREEFLFGVDRILDGTQALIEQTASRSALRNRHVTRR
jgi:AcrR family transcriptional regulator